MHQVARLEEQRAREAREAEDRGDREAREHSAALSAAKSTATIAGIDRDLGQVTQLNVRCWQLAGTVLEQFMFKMKNKFKSPPYLNVPLVKVVRPPFISPGGDSAGKRS